MNKVFLEGNVVQKPELRQAGKDNVVTFTIAVNEPYRKANGEWDKKTEYVRCEAWSTAADNIAKNVDKGDAILVDDGSLQTDTWEKDGQKRQSTKVRVRHFKRLYRPAKKDGAVTTEVTSEVPTDEHQEASQEVSVEVGVGNGEDIPF